MTEKYKMKLCLAGQGAVGKTSMVRRLVDDEFDDRYLSTLGAQVTRHVHRLDDGGTDGPVEVTMLIWDIMGQEPFRQMLKEAYFHGADAVLGVCDLTRPDTLVELESWMKDIVSVTGRVPVLFAGNKADLEGERAISNEDFPSAGRLPYLLTSAKTGEGVEEAFGRLAEHYVSVARKERSLETVFDNPEAVPGNHRAHELAPQEP